MEATFMSVRMGASMKSSVDFTPKQLPGFGCFRRICLQTSAHIAEMGPNLLFEEASMVAASMEASVEVVVVVPHLHRHP